MYVIVKHYHVNRERYKKTQLYRSPGAQVGSEDTQTFHIHESAATKIVCQQKCKNATSVMVGQQQ